MTTQKITKRDNFNELRSLIETSMLSNEDQDRLLAFIDHELELLDKRKASSAKNAKRGNKAQDELASKIADVLTADEAQTIPQILAQIDDETVTAAKCSYRLGKMVEAGMIARESVTIKEDGKTSRKVNGYRLIEIETETDAE